MVGALVGLGVRAGGYRLCAGCDFRPNLRSMRGRGRRCCSGCLRGAPSRTTLIGVELTGDWQTGFAVMWAVSIVHKALSSKIG